jgi:hypothetical protein
MSCEIISGRGGLEACLRVFNACRIVGRLALAGLCSAVFLGAGSYADLPESPISDLYNTGVDAAGQALSQGITDPHWTVTASPASTTGGGANFYNGGAQAEWIAGWTSFTSNTGTSTWITAPNAEVVAEFGTAPVNGNSGLYTFQTTFTLPPNFVSARIAGNWSADNLGGQVPDFNDNAPDPNTITNFVNINGNTVAPGSLVYGFSPTGFEITTGFVPGLNVLQFNVSNLFGTAVPNPVGTQIVFTSATYAVPEPFAAVLAVSGLAGLGGLGLLRRRRAARQGTGPRNAG